jgi:trimeric autotransporter adhesin
VRKFALLVPLLALAATVARAGQLQVPCAGVLLRASDGAPVAGADTIYGERVAAVAADGQGGWFVGGDFWSVGSQTRWNLAHIDRNGHVYTAWHPAVDGDVEVLARSGRTLYLAGSFRNVAGVARAGIAAVDTVTGRVTGWRPSVGKVDQIVATRSAVYIASGQTITPVDATTGATTGTVLTGGGPFVVTPARTYLFTGGPYYGGLEAVETSSGEPDEWSPGTRGYYSSLTYAYGRVLATGRFQAGGRRQIGLASWTSGSGRLLWIAHADGFVNSAAVDGTRVYLGGLFRILGGQKRPRLGAVDLRNGHALAWNPKWNAGLQWTPVVVAAAGGRVFVGAAVTASLNTPACARRP